MKTCVAGLLALAGSIALAEPPGPEPAKGATVVTITCDAAGCRITPGPPAPPPKPAPTLPGCDATQLRPVTKEPILNAPEIQK